MATPDLCDICWANENQEGGENQPERKKPESKETVGGGRKGRPRHRVLPVAGEQGKICKALGWVQLLLPNIGPEAPACQG